MSSAPIAPSSAPHPVRAGSGRPTSPFGLAAVRRALATVALAALPLSAWSAPVISPFAADLPSSSYSQSGLYGPQPGWNAEYAFNGGYWNAGSQGPDWIQADMGTTRTLSMVRMALGGSVTIPAGAGWVRVYLSDDPIGHAWSSLTPVAVLSDTAFLYGDGDVNDIVFDAPASGRYLQAVVHYGTYSWVAVGGFTPRVDWVDPITPGGGGSVPAPSTAALLGLSLLGLAAARRR